MKILPIRPRWLLLLLWLGFLNLTICLVFPNCALLEEIDLSEAPVLKELPSDPLGPTLQAFHRRRFLNSTPIPESQWNALGLWQKIRSDPATYVPKGYATTPPVGNSRGTWHVDPRDGKRLFAPNITYNDYRPETWDAEARKITGPGV